MEESYLVTLVKDFKSLGKSKGVTFSLLRLNFIDEFGIIYYRQHEWLLEKVINKVYSGGS